MLKTQSKVKELTRELRNKTEESDEYKRKMETLKNDRRRGEKTITEVTIGKLTLKIWTQPLPPPPPQKK